MNATTTKLRVRIERLSSYRQSYSHSLLCSTDVAFRNDFSFQIHVHETHTTVKTALDVTLGLTVAGRFIYVHPSHVAFLIVSGAEFYNTLPYPLSTHCMQLRHFGITLRTTRKQPPYIACILIPGGANCHYNHFHSSTQCVMSAVDHKLRLRSIRNSSVLTFHPYALIRNGSAKPDTRIMAPHSRVCLQQKIPMVKRNAKLTLPRPQRARHHNEPHRH